MVEPMALTQKALTMPAPKNRVRSQAMYGLDKCTPAFWAHTWKPTRKTGVEARLWPRQMHLCLLSPHLKADKENGGESQAIAWTNAPPPPEPTPKSWQEKWGQKPGYGLNKHTPTSWAYIWKSRRKTRAEARLWPGQTHLCLLDEKKNEKWKKYLGTPLLWFRSCRSPRST